MAEQGAVDVTALVAEIETTVARRRAAGEYPAELLAQLHAEFSPEEGAEPPETLALIQSARPLHSTKPVLGPAIVAAKKVVRRLLSWYVHPIAHDQTRFNDAIVRDLRGVERRLARLETVSTPGSGWGTSLASARAQRLIAALQGIPPGPVLIIGADSALRDKLGALPLAQYASTAPLERLELAPVNSLSAVVLPGLLARLSAAELVAVFPAAARVLRTGGRVVCDFPDGAAVTAMIDPSAVDVAMQRWLSRETVQLLIEAASLTATGAAPVDATPVAWATLVAEKTAATA